VPAPDLTICLGGDPEKIYARKPETSLEEVKRQTEVLKEFASTHKKAVWVDTTTTPEESIKAAMDAIVKMMSKRFANTKL
jgi:orotate phosphoribosyltransferase-like protein